ncbi:hypothetical protein [Acidiphilium sp. 20-67-58]|jgi:hypothetical protein|nr:hypothetical protein [Acidiphilium sp. 20-67-58]
MQISSTQVVMDDGPVPERAYRQNADPVRDMGRHSADVTSRRVTVP